MEAEKVPWTTEQQQQQPRKMVSPKTTYEHENHRDNNKTQDQSPSSLFDNQNTFNDDFGLIDEKYGESFWLTFLEEEQNQAKEGEESSYEENDKSRRGTMVGHEIEQTWSQWLSFKYIE